MLTIQPSLSPQTPLHLAVITEQPAVLAQLMSAGCDPQLVDNSGNTALHIACKKGSVTCFSVLTQACSSSQLTAMLTTLNYSGKEHPPFPTPLGLYSSLESGVSFCCCLHSSQIWCIFVCVLFFFLGQNCLHLVSIHGYLALVERLVELGADINAQVIIRIYWLHKTPWVYSLISCSIAEISRWSSPTI